MSYRNIIKEITVTLNESLKGLHNVDDIVEKFLDQYKEHLFELTYNESHFMYSGDRDFVYEYISYSGDDNLPEEPFYNMEETLDVLSKSRSFKSFFDNKIEGIVKNIVENVLYGGDSSGYNIVVHREMLVPEDFLSKMMAGEVKKLGEYWSWDEDAAEAHWGKGDVRIKIGAEVTAEDVEWSKTIEANFTIKDEREVYLGKGVELELKYVEFDDITYEEGDEEFEALEMHTFFS